LVLLIVYLVVRKTGKVEYSIAPEALSAQRRNLAINWAIFLGAIGSFIGAVQADLPWLAAGGLGLLIASLISYFVGVRNLYAARIDDHCIWLKGIRPDVARQIAGMGVDWDADSPWLS